MLTEREGGREETASGPALLNLVNYFTSAGICNIVLSESPENELFALTEYLSETYWDCSCRIKLTGPINKCLLRENHNKRTNYGTQTFSFIPSSLCSLY